MSNLIDFFKKYWLVLALILVAVLLPTTGYAEPISEMSNTTIKPKGSDNAWTLYVFGSARVIQELFMSIKLLVAPDIGSSGFISLMYLVATIGFFVLAVAAGFEPGKNFVRMFTYIIVVWAIVFSTTKLKADLHIIDKVGNTAPEVVTGAPALIVIPASLISQIGEYFSRSVETYFSIPGNFKMSNVGQFNLFATMLADTSQFKIKDEGISKTMTAYAGDCIVPAIARGQFSGPMATVQSYGDAIINPGAPTVTNKMVYGYDALIKTTDLMETYKSAASKAILTKYYPANGGKSADGSAYDWKSKLGISDSMLGSPSNSADFGVVVPCEAAYNGLKNDIEIHANALLTASGKAWGAAGGNQLYSTLFTDMLSSASSTEGPASYIRQKALLYEINNSFKGAAMMAGNNEVLQSLAISQAEQQQKSMMVSAFSVFNNMMGYMYTVLQAFLFGMAPIIILAMLVPGLGKSILVNYMQVLIWLALWTPLLGIVNYIITLFGQYDMAQAFQMAGGGLNKTNDALVSEKANNLIIAGQFLGTLVPMISWGIIKGAMAFTEFINHGIGSQFAAQAGATAATGNYSLNNASADNLSMNKFSTQMSSAVGAGPVQAGLGAGATSLTSDSGGSIVKNAGVQANPSQQLSNQLQNMKNKSEGASAELSAAQSKSSTLQDMMDKSKSAGYSLKNDAAASAVVSELVNIGKTHGWDTKISFGNGKSMTVADALDQGFKLDANMKAGLEIPGIGGAGVATQAHSGQTAKIDAQKKRDSATGGGASDGGQLNTTSGEGNTFQRTKANGQHVDGGIKESHTKSFSSQDVISAAAKQQKSLTESYTNAMSQVSSMNLGQSADRDMVASMVSKWNNTPYMTEDSFNKDMQTLGANVRNVAGRAGVSPDNIVNMNPEADAAERKRIEGAANTAGNKAAVAGAQVEATVKPGALNAEEQRLKDKKGAALEDYDVNRKNQEKTHASTGQNLDAGHNRVMNGSAIAEAAGADVRKGVAQDVIVNQGAPTETPLARRLAEEKAKRGAGTSLPVRESKL